VIMLPF